MPLRFGTWWPNNPETGAHAGYTRVTGRGNARQRGDERWGTVTGFSMTCGRPDGQFHYVGSTATITVEGWEFDADTRLGINTPVAVRWDSGDSDEAIAADEARWRNGPPCLFAGYVIDHPIRHLIGEDGSTHTIVTVEADDWLGSPAHQSPWRVNNEPDLPHTIHDFLRNTEGIRDATDDAVPKNRVQGVILGDWNESSGLAHDDDSLPSWMDVQIGDAITAATISTGTELFMRHGHRLGAYPGSGPPDERDRAHTDALGNDRGRAVNGKFYIRDPQLVLRQIGGPTTYDVEHVELTDDDGTGTNTDPAEGREPLEFNPTGAGGDPETHLVQRYRVGNRVRELEVDVPAPLDRVTLYGFHYDESEDDDDQPTQFAESVTRVGAREREFVEFTNLPVEKNDFFLGHLAQVAQRLRLNNTNAFRVYQIELPNLTDDEMNYWAGIGIADEVAIPRPDSTVTGSAGASVGLAEVRQYRWDCSITTGYMLTLWLVYHPHALPDPEAPVPPPDEEALWSGVIVWSQGADAKGGWGAGYGTLFGLADDSSLAEFRSPDDSSHIIRLRSILRNRNGEIEIETASVANQDELEGLFLEMQVPGLTVWIQIPPDSTDTSTSIRVIPESFRPAQQTPVFVEIWENLPEGATLSPVAPPDVATDVTVPNVVGQTQDQATNTLQGQGFNVSVVMAPTSDTTLIGNVTVQNPAAGDTAAAGSTVTITVAVAQVVQMVAVPDLVTPNFNQSQAEQAITDVGLVAGTPTTTLVYIVGEDERVQSQTPAAGTQAAAGSTVNFVLGSLAVPDLLGQNEVAAAQLLATAGLVGDPTDVPVTDQAQNDLVQAGQMPAAHTEVDAGTTVTYQVGDYQAAPTQVAVPNLDPLTKTTAEQAITDAGLAVGTLTATPSLVMATDEHVVDGSQSPAAGTMVNEGTAVTFEYLDFVGIQVPDLVGQPQATAEQALTDLGLTHTTAVGSETDVPERENVVEAQSETAGTFVFAGTEITLTIWDYEAAIVPTRLAAATILVGTEDDAWYGWDSVNGHGSIQPSPWQYNYDGELIVMRRIDINANRSVRVWTVTNDQMDEIETRLYVRLELPGVATAVVFQIPDAGGNNRSSAPNELAQAADRPNENEVLFAEIWDGQPSATIAPRSLWSTTLTWGSATGFGGWGSDHGSVVDAGIDFNGDGTDDVTLLGINRAAATGDVTVSASSAAEYDRLQGMWLRIEPTDSSGDDVIFQFPDSDTAAGTSSAAFPAGAIPDDGTQIAVSIWNVDPSGQDSTPNLPIPPDPVQLWSGVLTWGESPGSDPREGFADETIEPGNSYGSLTNNGVAIPAGGTPVTFRRIARLGDIDAEGRIRIDTATAEQADALQGRYLRLELAGDMLDGVIFQIDDEIGTSATSTTIVSTAEYATLTPGTQFVVSIWDRDPTDEPRTAGYPLPPAAPPTALASTTITSGHTGDEPNARWGFRAATDGNPYGSINPSSMTVGGVSVTLDRFFFRQETGAMLLGTTDEAGWDALEGKYFRITFPTGFTVSTVIQQWPVEGRRSRVDDTLPDNSLLDDNMQFTVEWFDEDPS